MSFVFFPSVPGQPFKLALALVLCVCLGCRRKEEPTVDAGRLLGSTPGASDVKDGGTFIWGRSEDAVKLDPAQVTDGESVQVITNIFDTLVSFKPGTTEIVPWLAKSWTTSADKLEWTFKLRDDVKFHDGSPLTADAVVFSFLRQKDENHPGRKKTDVFAYYSDNFKKLESVEKVDDHTVRFRLSNPYAPFLAALALFSTSIVCPNAFEKSGKDGDGRYKYDVSQDPIGTGPFRFSVWERGSRIVLLRNPDHFAGAPHIEKLVFKPIKDSQARLKELEAGGIHGMTSPGLGDLAGILANKRLRLLSRPGVNVCYLAMHTQKRPFDDPRVRRAVAFAVDKRNLIEAAYEGQAEAAVTMVPASMKGCAKIPDRRVDLRRAKKLLADAGLESGFQTTLWYPNNVRAYLPEPETTAIQIQQDLKQIGIEAKLVKKEWSAYLQAVQNGKHDMCILGWMADIGDPDNFLYVLLDKENAIPGQSNNLSFYMGERVHKLLIEAQSTYVWDHRERAYHDAQRILFEEVPVLPLATVNDFRVLAEDIRGYTIFPAGGEYFRDVGFAK